MADHLGLHANHPEPATVLLCSGILISAALHPQSWLGPWLGQLQRRGTVQTAEAATGGLLLPGLHPGWGALKTAPLGLLVGGPHVGLPVEPGLPHNMAATFHREHPKGSIESSVPVASWQLQPCSVTCAVQRSACSPSSWIPGEGIQAPAANRRGAKDSAVIFAKPHVDIY